jgi:hypothetical protein
MGTEQYTPIQSVSLHLFRFTPADARVPFTVLLEEEIIRCSLPPATRTLICGRPLHPRVCLVTSSRPSTAQTNDAEKIIPAGKRLCEL